MPFASGVIRPAIVLPASATGWSDRRRRAVLVHELAHVRRFDLLMNVLGRFACALYWFHPLVWMAARRMRADSERAADDTVLSVGTRASEYADHLLQIVCAAGRSSTPAVALPMAQRKEFEGRMLAILEANSRRSSPSRRHALAVAALALALVLPTAALAPATAGPPKTDPGSRSAIQHLSPASPSADMPGGVAPQRPAPATPQNHTVVKQPANVPQADQPPNVPAARAQSEPQDTDSSRLIAALVHALDDPVAEVRENAVYALGEREAHAAVPAVAQRLRRDESAKVREMAGWALGQIEDRAATPALGEAARLDGDASVRATAVWALGQIGQPNAAAALASALGDRVEEVRARAAWALGKVDAKTAPAELLRALRDPSPAVRMRVAWALGQIEDPAAASALAPMLDDSSDDVRKAAFWALSRLDSDDARAVLIRLLDSKDADIRAHAVRALAGHHSDPWPWPWPQPRFR
jgi:HEAT repeat protein